MPDYAIKVPEPDFKFTESVVFYADSSLMIYRDGPYVRAVDENDEQIHKMRCPSNFKHFEAADLEDAVLLMFSGEYITVIDKAGVDVQTYGLDIQKTGTCITPMKLTKSKSSVVFGSRSRGFVQFVNYDFIKRARLAQTSSWKMANINDFTLRDDVLYALLDNSFIVSVSVLECEPLWTHFETGQISPKLVPSKDELYYSCGHVLRHRNLNRISQVESIKIPLVKINSVEAKFGDNVILTALGGLSLCCYNTAQDEVKWQIRSNLAIQQTLPIKLLVGGKANDGLAVMTKDHFTIVDCTKGRNVFHTEFKNIARIRQTGSHLLVHKYNGSTGVIAGERI